MTTSHVLRLRAACLLLLASASVGCGDETAPFGSPDAAPDGTASDGGADDAARGAPVGLALLHADKSSSSLSLLTPTGAIAKDDCLHSGSTSSGFSQAFSGDVALPSQMQPNNAVVIIDRKYSVLTYLDGTTCAVQKQINVSTNFNANPHDVAGLSATKAYVSRYAQNLTATPAAEDLDDGNDLLVYDPSSGALIKRIDLLPFAVPSPANEPTLPRADRMVLIGTKLYVALNNLSGDYKASGHGRVLIIDTATDTVVGQIDLPSLKNCGALSHAGDALFVACNGVFADGAMQAAHAGVVRIALSNNQISTLGSSVFGNGLLSGFTLGAMDANRVAAVTLGEFGASADRLWAANFATASATQGYEGSKAFTLWSMVVDRGRSVLWLTDSGNEPALRSFTVAADGALTAGPAVQTSLTRKLSPREVAWF